MKSLTSRCGAALLLASALAACGGRDSGSLPVSGSIIGLNRPGLILSNGGKQLVIDGAPTTFSFPDLLAPDTAFEVLVDKSPAGQKCTPSNNKNKINYYTYSTTVISCSTDPFPLGGTIAGLSGSGLVLANGDNTVAPLAGATTFTFPVLVPNGAPYGVTVLKQPAGQTCTVANGTAAQMPMAAVTTVAVTCI
jgi:hypothetical protein